MVAQFSRDYSSDADDDLRIARAYSDDESGINFLSTRIANMTTYLKEKYNKPVFLPYISMATATGYNAPEPRLLTIFLEENTVLPSPKRLFFLIY